jgi:hypothetical protein
MKRLIDWLLSPIFAFADARYDEADRAIALGGADISLPDQLRRHAAGSSPDYGKFPVHFTCVTEGAQRNHGA